MSEILATREANRKHMEAIATLETKYARVMAAAEKLVRTIPGNPKLKALEELKAAIKEASC